jgi:hypothetical protein
VSPLLASTGVDYTFIIAYWHSARQVFPRLRVHPPIRDRHQVRSTGFSRAVALAVVVAVSEPEASARVSVVVAFVVSPRLRVPVSPRQSLSPLSLSMPLTFFALNGRDTKEPRAQRVALSLFATRAALGRQAPLPPCSSFVVSSNPVRATQPSGGVARAMALWHSLDVGNGKALPASLLPLLLCHRIQDAPCAYRLVSAHDRQAAPSP